MKRRLEMTQRAIDYRNNASIETVKYPDGSEVPLNGCLEADEFEMEVREAMSSEAVSFTTTWAQGDMPIFKYDAAFKAYLKERQQVCRSLEQRGISWNPWDVLRALPANRKDNDFLYFSQGSVPSCMGHADAFAHESSALMEIAITNSPITYRSINPIVTWYLSKGKSMRGGQSVSVMSKWSNEHGLYPISNVGRTNTVVPENYPQFAQQAKENQNAVVFFTDDFADQIWEVCMSGLAVACGNSTAVRGAQLDKNNMRLAVISGSWAHATHLAGYLKVKGEEYIGWINSHGARYGTNNDGAPADMCWMTRPIFKQFCSTMRGYGAPYAVIPEAPAIAWNSLERIVSPPMPAIVAP